MPRALSTTFRLAAGLAAAAAVLAVGAWAGGALQPVRAAGGRPSPATAQQARAYPNRLATSPAGPGGARAPQDPEAGEAPAEIPLGDSLVVNGQPMQISLFTTRDGPEQVIGFYAAAFEKRGLHAIATADAHLGHVSVFDPEDGMQRFISALPQADGETLVMVGITNPRRPPKLLRGAQGAPFPVPEENRGFLGYSSDDHGARAQSGQFVSKLTLEELKAWYRKELAAQGFAEAADSSDSLLLFARPGVSLSVAVQQLDAKAGVAVFVNRLEGGAQ